MTQINHMMDFLVIKVRGKYILLFLILFYTFNCNAQSNLDSLKNKCINIKRVTSLARASRYDSFYADIGVPSLKLDYINVYIVYYHFYSKINNILTQPIHPYCEFCVIGNLRNNVLDGLDIGSFNKLFKNYEAGNLDKSILYLVINNTELSGITNNLLYKGKVRRKSLFFNTDDEEKYPDLFIFKRSLSNNRKLISKSTNRNIYMTVEKSDSVKRLYFLYNIKFDRANNISSCKIKKIDTAYIKVNGTN